MDNDSSASKFRFIIHLYGHVHSPAPVTSVKILEFYLRKCSIYFYIVFESRLFVLVSNVNVQEYSASQ